MRLPKPSRSLIIAIRFKYLPPLLRPLLKVKPRRDIVALGETWGVWHVPEKFIRPESICYCVGVGVNSSFDEALIRQYGCDVEAFDPTPLAVEHSRKVAAREPKFHFHEVGLWKADTTLKFFFPNVEGQDVFSAVNIKRTERYVECKVERLSTIMKRLGHSHINLFKLDVEGAEYEVLENMIEERIFPTVLAVEFDQPMPVRRTLKMIRKLQSAGYDLVHIQLWNYTFVRSDANASS